MTDEALSCLLTLVEVQQCSKYLPSLALLAHLRAHSAGQPIAITPEIIGPACGVTAKTARKGRDYLLAKGLLHPAPDSPEPKQRRGRRPKLYIVG